MAKPIHGLLDRLIEQFAAAVALGAVHMFARSAAGRSSRLGAAAVLRMSPAPGCKNPGAGPRNRWFCRDHAKSVPVKEQKRILLERTKATQAAARLARARKGGRRLDMRCRVEGCKNTSRGPRFGYICDKHRSELSVKQQREARAKWNAAHQKAA
jgi:hypothetical protein